MLSVLLGFGANREVCQETAPELPGAAFASEATRVRIGFSVAGNAYAHCGWNVDNLRIFQNPHQPNTPRASLVFAGQDDPPWPLTATVDVTSTNLLAMDVHGAPQAGYALVNAPAALLPTGLPTTRGLLELDVSQEHAFVMDGITQPSTPLGLPRTRAPPRTSS